MKRLGLFLFSAFTALAGTVCAQDEQKSIDGAKAGDFAVGIEASPVLDFVGNMFNGNPDNASAKRWDKQDYTLHGRYFIADDAAVRLHLRFNPKDNKTIEREFIKDDAARTLNPLSNDKVEDKHVSYQNDWKIGAGYQMFRGQGRLRGFGGGDLFYRYHSASNYYYYGNKMNEFNSAPTSAGWVSDNSKRTISDVHSGTHSLGLVAFTGAEFYFISHACIGFEVGLAIQGSFGTRSLKTEETMVGSQYTKIETQGAPSNSTFRIGTNSEKNGLAGTGYGNFYLMFHF